MNFIQNAKKILMQIKLESTGLGWGILQVNQHGKQNELHNVHQSVIAGPLPGRVSQLSPGIVLCYRPCGIREDIQ
jgi:hypothetical protein